MADAADEAEAEVRIEPSLHDVIGQDVEHIERRSLLRVGAVRRHRIVHVHDGEDAGKFADLFLLQAFGIPRAVVSLVVLQHGLGDCRVLAEIARHDEFMAEPRMLLHDLSLIGRQYAFLVEHRLLYTQVADIDEKARRDETQLILARHLEPLAHEPREDCHMEAVMDHVLAADRHVVDMRDRLGAGTKRQDALRQRFRRSLVNGAVRPRHLEERLEFDEALTVFLYIPRIENRLLYGDGAGDCPLRRLGNRRSGSLIRLPDLHGDDIALGQRVNHLLIQHRAFP